MSTVEFFTSLKSPGNPLHHVWEHTVGSGHALLALRADWQRDMNRCYRELGFKHVRFHGLLSDDVGTLVCENDQLVYSFFNADQICDFLLSIGMKPFIELSFMPTTLSSGGDIVFHYKDNVTPPKDFTAWGVLIEKLVRHWKERYGEKEVSQWFFEVWNEPNLKAFWTGTQEEYFKLYDVTVRAIKKVSPSFKVGGPATAQNAWISEFLEYTSRNELEVNFISTHHYPTDAFGKPGDNTEAQLAQSYRSVLKDEARGTYEKAEGKPVYYTEWSTSSNPFDELHDQSYAAAYIIKTVLEVREFVQGYSYWTFSDIFEENYFSSVPYHGGFGLLNIYGIPKPAYRAFELLHRLGTEIIPVEGTHETVDVWLTRQEKTLKILATNSSLPRHPVKTEIIKINLKDLDSFKTAYIERIDDEHSNSYQRWIEMGKPQSLNPNQVSALENASTLRKQPLTIAWESQMGILEFSIPPQGVVCITLEL